MNINSGTCLNSNLGDGWWEQVLRKPSELRLNFSMSYILSQFWKELGKRKREWADCIIRTLDVGLIDAAYGITDSW